MQYRDPAGRKGFEYGDAQLLVFNPPRLDDKNVKEKGHEDEAC